MAGEDGGPAFPLWDKFHGEVISGMSLRDWLIGQALNGLSSDQELGVEETAKVACRLADAALREREK